MFIHLRDSYIKRQLLFELGKARQNRTDDQFSFLSAGVGTHQEYAQQY